ncbi:hypothetical protein JTB14_030721 [Gonioctena quinquepunctata]|nr:hypothetical protein JTB14_030721 [Gonioctena quinquepunctata]
MLVSDSMRRDWFAEIMRFVDLADNNYIDTLDKMYKLRPLMNALKTKCPQYFVPQEQLDFDESMMKYYGCHNYHLRIQDCLYYLVAGTLFQSINQQELTNPQHFCCGSKSLDSGVEPKSSGLSATNENHQT